MKKAQNAAHLGSRRCSVSRLGRGGKPGSRAAAAAAAAGKSGGERAGPPAGQSPRDTRRVR